MSLPDRDDSPFLGRTSATPWRLPYEPLERVRCGSSLTGRRQAVRRTTIRGVAVEVEAYRCPCGRGKHVRREVAAA